MTRWSNILLAVVRWSFQIHIKVVWICIILFTKFIVWVFDVTVWAISLQARVINGLLGSTRHSTSYWHGWAWNHSWTGRSRCFQIFFHILIEIPRWHRRLLICPENVMRGHHRLFTVFVCAKVFQVYTILIRVVRKRTWVKVVYNHSDIAWTENT